MNEWPLLATFLTATGASLWGIALVVRDWRARCLVAPALGSLGGLVGGLAWLYSLRPVWRRTLFYCCTSDESTWPPGMTVESYVAVFALAGGVAGLLALGGLTVASVLRGPRRARRSAESPRT